MVNKVIIFVLVTVSLFLFTSSSINTEIKNKEVNNELKTTDFILKQKLMKPDYIKKITNYYYILQNKNLILKTSILETEYYSHDIKDTINIEKLDNLKVSYFDLNELPKGVVLEIKPTFDDNDMLCKIKINNKGKILDCVCPDFIFFCVSEKQTLN